MPRITPNLWFDTQGLEAAEYYVSIFPASKVTDITYYGEGGPQPAGAVLTGVIAADWCAATHNEQCEADEVCPARAS